MKLDLSISTMWMRIRAVIIEDEPLAAQYLATLLDDTCQVEVVGYSGISVCRRFGQRFRQLTQKTAGLQNLRVYSFN